MRLPKKCHCEHSEAITLSVYNSLDVYSKEKRLKKIVIVDDLSPFVGHQKSILSRSSVHIFTAASGPEALSTHRNVKADLLVTDLDMPGMAGDELCSIIRKDPDLRFVSILIVTKPREADISRCKKCGVARTIKRSSEEACQHGIKFTSISEAGRKIIDEFVKSCSASGQYNCSTWNNCFASA